MLIKCKHCEWLLTYTNDNYRISWTILTIQKLLIAYQNGPASNKIEYVCWFIIAIEYLIMLKYFHDALP